MLSNADIRFFYTRSFTITFHNEMCDALGRAGRVYRPLLKAFMLPLLSAYYTHNNVRKRQKYWRLDAQKLGHLFEF